jgi:hypothetical protein
MSHVTPQEEALARITIFLHTLYLQRVTVLVKDKYCSVQGTLERRDRTLPTVYLVNGYGSAAFRPEDVYEIQNDTLYLK